MILLCIEAAAPLREPARDSSAMFCVTRCHATLDLAQQWDARVEPDLSQCPAVAAANFIGQFLWIVIRISISESLSRPVEEILTVDERHGARNSTCRVEVLVMISGHASQ